MKSIYACMLSFFITDIAVADDPCLFNPSTNSYQTCYHLTADGKCVHFGAACNVATPNNNVGTLENNQCMLNPKENTYQICFHVTADGKCAHFGPPCH